MTTSETATLEAGSQLLARFSGQSGPHRLHLGNVSDVREGVLITEFEEEDLVLPGIGDPIMLFFHVDGMFCQQPGQVAGVSDTPITTVEVEPTADPVSAESRQTPRIPTVASDLIGTLGEEQMCPVLDISDSGFAVMSSELYEVGDVVGATIQNGAESYGGSACVQSRRELWEGRYRYGLYCLDDDASATLKAGLGTLSDLLAG